MNRGETGAAPLLPQQNFTEHPHFAFQPSVQQTLANEVRLSGIGLFTGEKTEIKICPAPADTGIVFIRKDLVGSPVFPAKLPFVCEAPRCTCLTTRGEKLFMVEHLLSGLFGCGVQNAVIEVNGPEIPAGDGSAQIFVDALEATGLCALDAPVRFLEVETPVFWSDGTVHLVALPSPGFSISYTMHYPQSSLLGSQYIAYTHDVERYKAELASCRTFSLYEEIAPFIEKGWIKGGSLDNALVIQGDRILNPGGARFPDEMARHKVLDLIGDLSLLGRPLLAHIIAVCSGHASHFAFAKTLSNHFALEEMHGG